MKLIQRPTPINVEVPLDPFKTIMSKTDKKGIIEFANDYFMQICEYKEWELMGQPHNVIRHPDMPKIIFKILWNRLFNGKNIHAVVKNLTKTGKYYWVVTDFKIKYDESGNIKAIYSRRKAVPENVKDFFAKLYADLIKLEKIDGMNASGAYLSGYLEDLGKTYDEFILDLFDLTEKQLVNYMEAQISNADLDSTFDVSAEQAIKKSKNTGFLSRIFK